MKIHANPGFVSYLSALPVLFLFILLVSCRTHLADITSGSLKIEVNNEMQTRLSDGSAAGPLMAGFSASEYLIAGNDTIRLFSLKSVSEKSRNDFAGDGKQNKGPAAEHQTGQGQFLRNY